MQIIFEQPQVQSVTSTVTTAIEEVRLNHFEDIVAEFNLSTNWVKNSLRCLKRKIFESNENEPHWKRKRSIIKNMEAKCDKGNNGPNNIVNSDFMRCSFDKKKTNLPQDQNNKKSKDSQPDYELHVNSLRVVDLRIELRKRGIDTSGLKRVLQERLLSVLEAEKIDRKKEGIFSTVPQGNEGTVDNMDIEEVEEKEVEITHKKDDVKAANLFCVASVPSVNSTHASSNVLPSSSSDCTNIDNEGHLIKLRDSSKFISTIPLTNITNQKCVISMKTKDILMTHSTESSDEISTNQSIPKGPSGICIESSRHQVNGHANEEGKGNSIGKLSTNSLIVNEDSLDENLGKSAASTVGTMSQKLLKVTNKLFSPCKAKIMPDMKEIRPTFQEPGKGVKEIIEEMEIVKDIKDKSSNSPTQERSLSKEKRKEKRKIQCVLKQKIASDSKSNLSPLRSLSENDELDNKQVLPHQQKNIATPSIIKVVSVDKKATSSKSIKSKKLALAEARKARLAEMRGKTKPVTLSQATKKKFKTTSNTEAFRKNISALSSHLKDKKTPTPTALSNATASSMFRGTVTDHNERKKILDTQIREKAAAAAANKQVAESTQASSIVSQTQISQNTKRSPILEKAVAVAKKRAAESAHQHAQATQDIDRNNKSPNKCNNNKIQTKEEKVLSPMDTYEISDREDSDSSEEEDSDDEDDDNKKKKRVPSWAQRNKLLPMLEKQFLEGPGRMDPDEIFSEVSTCNLEEIFDQKKKRYVKRTSSGNWTKDRVTATEKLVYKREMGFPAKRKY